MGWVGQLLLAAMLFGCIVGCNASRSYSTPGTLYVGRAVAGVSSTSQYEIVEYRAGRVVAHKPQGFIVARDHPDRWLVEFVAPVCGGPDGDRSFQLSPDGSRALCSKGNDLRMFDPAHPQTARILVTNFIENASETSFGWLDNTRFLALVLDDSCPIAHLYDYYSTRVATFDIDGRRLSTGQCALGIVTGERRIALIGERHNGLSFYAWQFIHDDTRYYNDGYDRYHLVWSVDNGTSWHDGEPLTFDGNDRLLYAEPFGDTVRSEDGNTVFTNVYSVQWSR